MVRLEEKLRKEKEKLDEMVEKCNGNLTNDLVLEQSRKVDNLIVAYQKVKLCCINIPDNNLKYKVSKK
jgi:hypothetical protein